MGKNIILLSGGLDSKILLAKFHKDIGLALTFDYNINNEVEKARLHAKEYGVELKIIPLPVMDSTGEYPMRNLTFLSFAVTEALKLGAKKIFYATHYPPDYDQGYYYQDCSPEFVRHFNHFIRSYKIQLDTPFLYTKLEDEIREGIRLNVDFSDVQICNIEEGNCGICPKCREALNQLRNAGATTFPHFNRTIYSVENKKELMLEWLPIREMRLYINNRCQLSCDYCSYKYSQDAPSEELEIDDWFKVLDKAKELQIRSIMFSGKEPLIDEKIFPILKRAREMGFQTHINTNGLTLPKYEEKLRINHPDRLLVSVNGESYNNNSPTVANLSNYMAIQPYLVVLRDNLDFIFQLIGRFIGLGITRFYFRFVYPQKFSHEEEKEILGRLGSYPAKFQVPIDYSNIENWENYDRYLKGEIVREGNIEYTFVHNFCQAYYHALTILHTGDIVGCAKHTYVPWAKLKEYSIGNIMELSGKEIISRCKDKIRNSDLSMCLTKW